MSLPTASRSPSPAFSRFKLLVLTALAGVVLATSVGCGSKEEESITPWKRRKHKKSVTTSEVNTQNFLFNAEDFDLATVVALVKEDKVKDAEELEKVINKEDSAISNVDIDKDDIIDYVMVKEGREGEKILLDFKAVPSSTNKEDDAETIANMTFTKNTETNEVEVSGGYPEYAEGHRHHHYHYRGPSLGTMLFMTWLLTPSRPYYYRGYYAPYYARRPLYSRSALTSARTSYRSTRSVSPVSRTTRPANYNIKSASKANSKFAAGKSSVAKAKSSSLSSRKGSMKSFGSRSSTKTKRSASGFGASKSGSFKSKAKSSGFGSSSGSKSSGSRSSFGSRSSGSRSSFGSSSGSRSAGSRSRSSGARRRR